MQCQTVNRERERELKSSTYTVSLAAPFHKSGRSIPHGHKVYAKVNKMQVHQWCPYCAGYRVVYTLCVGSDEMTSLRSQHKQIACRQVVESLETIG